jgi:hypothetical protein
MHLESSSITMIGMVGGASIVFIALPAPVLNNTSGIFPLDFVEVAPATIELDLLCVEDAFIQVELDAFCLNCFRGSLGGLQTGEEWWQTFKTAASGTYVNQYMVTDFKKFTPGKVRVCLSSSVATRDWFAAVLSLPKRTKSTTQSENERTCTSTSFFMALYQTAWTVSIHNICRSNNIHDSRITARGEVSSA